MKTCVAALFFMIILKLHSCRHTKDVGSSEDGTAIEIPFGQSKVKYHRSHYCITAFGQVHCVNINEEPANPAKIARLYKLWTKGYKPKFKTNFKKTNIKALYGKKTDPERFFDFDASME